ncbi:methyl-accepting chemotaxis protein [Azotosporobacter soli]|uniref:methyl-accepting chemotaxis protein n=1 Tax=Azotosporobacter soli TaxID=3055040 RepID=UPI0031FEC45A
MKEKMVRGFVELVQDWHDRVLTLKQRLGSGGTVRKVGLREKLILMLGVWAFLAVAGSLAGLVAMQTANDRLVDMYNQRLVALRQLKVVSDLYTVNIVDSSHKLRNGNLSWPVARQRVTEAQNQLQTAWQAYRAQPRTGEEEQAAIRAELQMNIASMEIQNLQTILLKEDKEQLGRFMIEVLYSSIEPVAVQMSELIDLELVLAKAEYEAAQASHAHWAKLFLALLTAGILVGSVLAVKLLRSLLKQISSTATAVERVAKGDLSGSLAIVATQDELGRLLNGVNVMTENLRGLVQHLAESACQVQDSAKLVEGTVGELSTVSANIAETGQALRGDAALGRETLVEVARSLLELSALVSVAKERAQDAGKRAKETREVAMEGQNRVSLAVNRMEQLHRHTDGARTLVDNLQECSKRISDINRTMTAISSQTKLLSLNAAIEAARSGEAGRGFNVVALEIGKLAELSSGSAAQVAALIRQMTDSSKAVADMMREYGGEVVQGTTIVTQAGDALSNILQAVANTVEDIEDIVSVTTEEVAQSDAIVELIDSLANVIDNSVNRADDLAELLQTNRSSVAVLAAGTEENRELAEQLGQAVAGFHLPDAPETVRNTIEATLREKNNQAVA